MEVVHIVMEKVLHQDPGIVETLQTLIDEGKTYQEISDILKTAHPSMDRGLSARSVRRFCSSKGISRRTDAELDAIISESVAQVSACMSIIIVITKAYRLL